MSEHLGIHLNATLKAASQILQSLKWTTHGRN